jgi:3-deoxy-7-phosphoheptulonate synthase
MPSPSLVKQNNVINDMKYQTEDVRILEMREVLAPEQLYREYPITDEASKTVFDTRNSIHNLLTSEDDRLFVIIGPCSIHDPIAAKEYALKLQEIREELQEDLLIVMRVYFEKPRTTVGWKGLINDPKLDDSFEINEGLRLARELLLHLNHIGVPAGTEFLDLISPQYISDLISWGAIGARTTESQGHRELASGVSCPIGFKNGTSGNIQIAVDAIRSANYPHHFLGVTPQGHSAIFKTTGNTDCHLILRGGKHPNYDSASIDDASALLKKANLHQKIMVDTSHSNSRKIYERQADVARDLAQQIAKGDNRIFGVMIESNLVEGRQDVIPDQPLVYGQSITDACIGWENTIPILRELAQAVKKRRLSNM